MAGEAERALLEWVNTFPIDSKVESALQLSDGLILNQILGALNQDYFVAGLEKNTAPSKWLSKKQNLESVYKSLLRFHREHPDYTAITIDNTPNLSSIAENGDTQETIKVPNTEALLTSPPSSPSPRLYHQAHSPVISSPSHPRSPFPQRQVDLLWEPEVPRKVVFALANTSVQLLTILLMAAISGENRAQHIESLQKLHGAMEIMKVIKMMQNVQEAATNEAPPWDAARLPAALTNDLELAAEEERAALFAEHTALKKRHADYMTRFEKLQDSYQDLMAKNEETEQELQSVRASSRGDITSFVEEMQEEIRKRDELISGQEFEIEHSRKLRERQEKELDSLRPASERVLALEDQVQELRVENAALSKKANMVDNFQRKLESQSNIDKDNARLREQIDTYRENQKHFDYTMQKNSTLQSSVDEYSKRFHNYELELVELSSQKKILEEEIRRRDAEIYKLNEQKRHDEDFIKDLQESFATSQAPTATNQTLGEELEQSNDSVNYALENSRLLAENQLLKSDTAGTRNADLRAENLELISRIEALEQKCNALTEEHAISQEQLNAIIGKIDNDKLVTCIDAATKVGPFRILTDGFYRDEAIMNTRRLYLDANRERETLRHEVARLTADITSRDRELLAVKGDLRALGEDPYNSLQELKATHELLTTSFEADLTVLKQQLKLSTADNEQQKSHLVDALLAKDKLRKEIAELRGVTDTTAERPATAKSQEPLPESKSAVDALTENEALKSSVEELQRKIKSLEENSAEAQKVSYSQSSIKFPTIFASCFRTSLVGLLKNVLRENAMMSTAWYDLSSRLQSNHVVLQRRQDAPKSWLNKQRQMVNATPRR
ncbi:microtubule binding protein [Phlyctema vagabunda]|uniref:Microtubule binding protein n=1 Tax=Phlyctema vagabunda TaxID=108571 RepID=A0ABR4P6D3_9HELO